MMAGADRKNLQPKIVVVGLGNPDRGDDGIGAIVARRLVGRLSGEVPVLFRSGDMLSLVEDWTGIDAVICIDAAAPMGAPGRIHRVDLAAGGRPPDIAPTSSHGFGIGDAVELARALGRAPRQIIVYAVEGSCFDGGAPVTPQVAAAAAAAADRIAAEVAALQSRVREGVGDA
jgi:hydrogenase maturation protease